MGNYNFTHFEDAKRHQERNGGIIHDNRHTAHEWNDNQFTVHIEPKKEVESVYYDEEIHMTRAEHEDWMIAKGWSDSIKEMHRKAFTGMLAFDEDGYFDYI